MHKINNSKKNRFDLQGFSMSLDIFQFVGMDAIFYD